MKKQFAYFVLAAALAVPVTLSTGCAVTQGRQTAKAYAKDREISTRIKTALYADPVAKGTQVDVQTLNGVVQLSGFVDSEQARNRAEQIAASVPGVLKVYNNLILPTGRQDNTTSEPNPPPGASTHSNTNSTTSQPDATLR
jgi:hypothetical protein